MAGCCRFPTPSTRIARRAATWIFTASPETTFTRAGLPAFAACCTFRHIGAHPADIVSSRSCPTGESFRIAPSKNPKSTLRRLPERRRWHLGANPSWLRLNRCAGFPGLTDSPIPSYKNVALAATLRALHSGSDASAERASLAFRGSCFEPAERWRYRLGARTPDSQSGNPGSIPGTATIPYCLISSAPWSVPRLSSLSFSARGCSAACPFAVLRAASAPDVQLALSK